MRYRKARLMQGNEACVEGAIDAGVRFYAGYPITPSTEVAEGMARKLPEVGGVFIQMEDEIASMAAIIGASIGGKKSLTATSGPGFSLKQENLGYAAIAEIPCVVVNVQRFGPSTGIPTAPSQGDVMQSRWGTHGDHPIIVLAPSSVYETYYLTSTAVNFTEKFRVPVVLLLDEAVGHMREKVALPEKGKLMVEKQKFKDIEEYKPFDERRLPPLIPFGEGFYYHITGLVHDEYGFPSRDPEVTRRFMDRLHQKLADHRDEIVMSSFMGHPAPRVGIVTYGCTVRSARAALKKAYFQNRWPVGMLSLQTLWPFASKEVEQLASRAEIILVPEMNMGQLVGEVEKSCSGRAKVIGVNRYDGEMITPEDIYREVERCFS